MAYHEMKEFEAAETAYHQSLQIEVRQGNRAGEADSLGQLGNLYNAMGRVEEAVALLRQTAEIYMVLNNLAGEGQTRNNIALRLIKLNRLDDARTELLRAIECKTPYGHVATPWTTFATLSNLEHTVGNSKAATQARQKAITTYLSYRRDGGENLSGSKTPQLIALISQAIQNGETAAATQQLAELQQHPNLPDYLKTLIPTLQQILSGNRETSLAEDPGLDFDDTVELKLLLEQLAEEAPPP